MGNKETTEGQRLDKCLHIQAGTHPMYVDNDTICLLHTLYSVSTILDACISKHTHKRLGSN